MSFVLKDGECITIDVLMKKFCINRSTAYLYIKSFDTNLALINNAYEIAKMDSKYYLKHEVGH